MSCGLSNSFDAPDRRILLLAVGQTTGFRHVSQNFSDKPTYRQPTARILSESQTYQEESEI
jgi:hypothetical protein